MGRRWGVALLAAVSAALSLATVARADFSITYPKGPDPAVAEWPSWPDPVSCGGLSFDPVAAFGGETGAENGTGAPEQALRKLIEEGLPGIPAHFWRVMAATETRVEFAQGRLAQGPFRLAVEPIDGRWRPAGMPGYCVPQTVRSGLVAASWEPAEGQRLGPGTRRVRVRLGGIGCDGGTSVNKRVRKEEFFQAGRRLVLTIWLEPLPPGFYTCQELIEPPLVVRLPGRLGERRLYDGRTYPPRPRAAR